MTNTTFANYVDMFPNLTESLQFPLVKNKTTYKQTLPTNLNITGFDKTLLNAPINPYHTEGYLQLVSTSTKHDYSHNCSNCSSMPSGTIVLYWVFGSKIDSRRCYPLFIILYIFLRWGHSFLVYIVPIPWSWANKNSSLDSIFKGPDNFDCLLHNLAGMLACIHMMWTIYNVHILTDHNMLTLLTCLYHINVLAI